VRDEVFVYALEFNLTDFTVEIYIYVRI
jgi:hypothetical protein